MEILIDFARVRRLLAQEYQQARTEIGEVGPIAAYERSQQRQDERLASAPDANTLACKAGCSWCCHFTIDLRPVEVFRILEHVERTFDAAAQERLRARLAINREITAPLDEMQRMQQNVECAFLDEGRCTIYAARPQTCRNYHATNAAGCQKSFEEPENLEIDPDFAPLVYQIGGAHVEAFAKAMRDEGYDVDAYEMNLALSAALEQPDARSRFAARQKPFTSIEGDEVPDEFSEQDD
ncbi:MAG: YkgJ family cysteine cluster protein [Povalibacter sp.]